MEAAEMREDANDYISIEFCERLNAINVEIYRATRLIEKNLAHLCQRQFLGKTKANATCRQKPLRTNDQV